MTPRPVAAVAVPRRSLNSAYEVHGAIGSGHFSTVYLATRRADGTQFAVKRILKDRYKGNEKLLEEEVAIHSSLRHRNVLRLEETFETDTEWQLVLQLAAGGELFSLVEQGQLPEAKCKALARSLLKAVNHIHAHGVVHRDIKPENILLAAAAAAAAPATTTEDEEEEEVLLADFGLATTLKAGERATKPCGSFEYAAPEILQKGSSGYDFKVDMWSVGVILFVILAGYHPFQDDDERRAFKRIVTGSYHLHPSRWNSVSEDAKDLVEQLLQVRPEVRLSASEALNHPWFDY